MPFQEQDGATAACATCGLWSAFCVSARLFGNRVPSPSAITALAVENSYSPNRKFPNHGLSVEEMCYAIRKTGLDPVVMQLDKYPTGMERAHMFLGAVYAYLNLGVSVIAVLDAKDKVDNGETIGVHAITINGYHLPEKDTISKGNAGEWLSAMCIDKFYANDDQCCPGARFMPKMGIVGSDLKINAYRGPSSKSSTPYRTYTPRSLIIPLYHKIHVTFEDVAKEVETCVGSLEKALQIMRKEHSDLPQTTLHLDITLRESNNFKADVRKDAGLPDAEILNVIKEKLPRFVWCVRIYCKMGDEDARRAAVILIDTTDSEQGLNVIGVIYYNCDLNGENAIRRMARCAFYQRFRSDFDSKQRRNLEHQVLIKALCLIENSKQEFDNLKKKANEDNSSDAHCHLGWMYEHGEGVAINISEALKHYEKAASKKNKIAQFNLGWMYEHGENVEKDLHKALQYYTSAANNNDGSAKFMVAKIYESLGEMDNAKEWYKKSAEEENVEAQYALAELYYNECQRQLTAISVQAKTAISVQAKKWYTMAANNGHVKAQCLLGQMYLKGYWGEKKAPKLAEKWYMKAAQQKDAKAQFELARMYETGIENGVENGVDDKVLKNTKQAVLWYTKAAEQGYGKAQYQLGLLLSGNTTTARPLFCTRQRRS